MKLNEQVIIHQDGKLCRSNIGVVVAKTRYKIKVHFVYEGKLVISWFRHVGGTIDFRDHKVYKAWCNTEEFCPFYTAVSLKRFQRNFGENGFVYINKAFENASKHRNKQP